MIIFLISLMNKIVEGFPLGRAGEKPGTSKEPCVSSTYFVFV